MRHAQNSLQQADLTEQHVYNIRHTYRTMLLRKPSYIRCCLQDFSAEVMLCIVSKILLAEKYLTWC